MIQIAEGPAPQAPGFDDPIGLLEACHARIAGHCATLERLQRHLDDVGPDAAARVSAQRILHYFDTAGVWHHQDEEQDLQPLLEAALRACDDTATLALLHALMTEHAALDQVWRPLRAGLVAVQEGRWTGTLPIEPYVSMMRSHYARENTTLFVRARALLDIEALAKLGAAMAARRGVQFEGSS